ncbi:MAG TPA: MFS transporter [Bryobacteraceae bacterium]|jgi:ACS family glucarate transporter-like MFS transporter|nr:MFS transporter [Bryobacteraceae bacterium]
MSSHPKSRMRWLVIGWMFLVSAISYLDRVNISIAGQSIANEFHLTNLQLGSVFSAFVLGYGLFQAPAGWVADRLGPRLVLTAGVLWWAIFTVSITLLSPAVAYLLPILIGLRFALGAGEAVVYPASNCIVASWIPSSERGLANGIIFSGVGFGAGITPPLISYLVVTHGWRVAFWASATLGLIAGAIWYAIARDRPRGHPWISPSELAQIEQHIPQKSTVERTPAMPLSRILSNFDVLAITFSYFCYGYTAYIFFSWFYLYLTNVRKLNIRDSAMFTMLPFLTMAVCSPLGGWIADRLTKTRGKRVGRCGIAGAAMLLAAVFLALGTEVDSAKLASVVLACGGGALYLSQSSFWAMTADIGKTSAGTVSGIMNMGGQMGGALTATLTPAIAGRFGWMASFLVAAALCVLGGLAWIPVGSARHGVVDESPLASKTAT